LNRYVVYTCILGPYNGLLPQPQFPDVDYICFTDQKFKSRHWKIIQIPSSTDPARESRRAKILPHLFLEDYEYSIFIDGNFLVLQNPIPLIQKALSEHSMAHFDHHKSTDARNCIYQEFEAIQTLYDQTGRLKDDLEVMEKQIQGFRKAGFPENHGLLKGGVLIRRHKDPQVIQVMNQWWDIVQQSSRRDQLSFNYVAWKNNFKSLYLRGDIRNNAYFYMLGVHRKNFWKKYLKYRIKKGLGILKHPQAPLDYYISNSKP